LFASSQVRTPL